jgi:hypothetical protein
MGIKGELEIAIAEAFGSGLRHLFRRTELYAMAAERGGR